MATETRDVQGCGMVIVGIMLMVFIALLSYEMDHRFHKLEQRIERLEQARPNGNK